MRRASNQDRFGVIPAASFFMVADGMGGHQGGETASSLSVESFQKNVHPNSIDVNLKSGTLPELVGDWLHRANAAIYKLATEEPSLHGMGTTTTCLTIAKESQNSGKGPYSAWIGHVGDSRCYFVKNLVQNPRLWLLTRDHSLVQEKLRAGIIKRSEVKSDPMKNMITRSVGYEEEILPETYEVYRCEPGDAFLLCSDGLYGHLEDSDILEILSRSPNQPPETITQRLIDAANNRGGDDNITAVFCVLK